jgi:hypothetical protein
MAALVDTESDFETTVEEDRQFVHAHVAKKSTPPSLYAVAVYVPLRCTGACSCAGRSRLGPACVRRDLALPSASNDARGGPPACTTSVVTHRLLTQRRSGSARGAFMVGAPLGLAMSVGRLWSEPGYAIQDRAFRLRESASQVRAFPPFSRSPAALSVRAEPRGSLLGLRRARGCRGSLARAGGADGVASAPRRGRGRAGYPRWGRCPSRVHGARGWATAGEGRNRGVAASQGRRGEDEAVVSSSTRCRRLSGACCAGEESGSSKTAHSCKTIVQSANVIHDCMDDICELDCCFHIRLSARYIIRYTVV